MDSNAPRSLVRTNRYLRALGERRAAERIKHLAGFGLVVGGICLLVGGSFLWREVGLREFWGFWAWLWVMLVGLGVVLAISAVLAPALLQGPYRAWMALGHFQGRVVMVVLLTIIYGLIITPLGFFVRCVRGPRQFLAWDAGARPPRHSGWQLLATHPVESTCEPGHRRRSLPELLLSTLQFFHARGQHLALPVIALLLILGLILFFANGSVLAPFIYTLF